jgi:uncharacterized DUF497 family protein
MKITYDPAKREKAFRDRGLDFEDARCVFSGPTFELEDTRKDYGERRIICYGLIEGRLVVIGYVERGEARHVFSMRKANEREIKRFHSLLG